MDTAQMYHLQGEAFPKSFATKISDGETIVSLPIASTYKENDEPTEVVIQYCNTADWHCVESPDSLAPAC